jgi:hypothetical protein
MKICVCKSDLGTSRNLHIIPGESFTWSDSHADWCTQGRVRSIRDLARYQGKDLPKPASRYVNALSSLNAESPAWQKILPSEEFKKFAKSYVDFCTEAYQSASSYETQVFPLGNQILQELTQCDVNMDTLRSHLESDIDPGNKSTLQTFTRPAVTRYDRFASVTGRTSVKSGPDILRLKKGFRDVLIPESGSRCIKQVDIISLEPRICLLIDGQQPKRDIYEHISKNVFRGDVTRDVVKLATICAMYGMSADKLAQKIPAGSDARRILGEVRSYFNIPALLQRLKKQAAGGFIENHFGKRIGADLTSPLVNHFLQSSGVDVSLIFFWNLFEASGRKISPKFIIHDAMVFTCEKDDLQSIESIVDAGVEVQGIGKIDAKVKEVM